MYIFEATYLCYCTRLYFCIKWDTKSTTMRSVSADLFLDTIGNLFLEQLVN